MNKVYNERDIDFNRYTVLRTPMGSGDLSWILTKFARLKYIINKDVGIAVAAKGELKRADELLSMIPDIEFMGYDESISSFQCMAQCLPIHPMCNGKMGIFNQNWTMNISANFHLESGLPLKDWFPYLPLDYHYKINIPREFEYEGSRITESMPKPLFGVYISGDRKDKQPGWEIFTTDEWIWLLKHINLLTGCSFIFVGKSYDASRTLTVSNALANMGVKVSNVIDKHLGVALQVFKHCKYTIHYPGGLGFLCDNLQVPVLMFLPHILKSMEKAEILDPMNLAYHTAHIITSPTPENTLSWFKRVGAPANDIRLIS